MIEIKSKKMLTFEAHSPVRFIFYSNKMLQDLSAEQERIEQILKTADLTGFTVLLS